ncbi:MAG TPA: CPBP family glutamic-type intramembrane protease [Bauldia sp.]|nr:CPBP family glutamic-type intramembrane protease [Bauldia sp.]
MRKRVVVSLAAFGVAAAVLMIDGYVFRASLPPWYATMLRTASTVDRLAYYLPRAVLEETIYRLLAVSAIAAGLLWGGLSETAAWWLAIGVAQAINVAVSLPPPPDVLTLLYDGLRFFAPGLVWGWLYWRHGFVAAVSAHCAAHLLLQPALSLAFADA